MPHPDPPSPGPPTHALLACAWASAVILVLGACTDAGLGPADTASDVAPEAISDAAPETIADAGPETVSDAAPETITDAGPETVADAGPETVADAAPDTAPDPGPTPPPVDTDGDGLPDSDELALGTDPAVADTDGDGLGDGSEVVRGLDPTRADTDWDGIPDGQEVADGTDPADPRSARAWHPEVTARPRLYFGPEDKETLRARAGLAGTSPDPALTTDADAAAAATLWAQLQATAAKAPETQDLAGEYDPRMGSRRALIAEAAAFVGWLTGDTAASQKAAEIMAASFPDPLPLNDGLFVDGGYDLYESEALASFCAAYDLLLATAQDAPNALPAGLLDAARARLLQRVADYRTICLGPGGYRNLMLLAQNNHTMKVMGGLGVCAVALSDRPEAAGDWSDAVAGLSYLLTVYQGNASGGYAEGWNYLGYGGQAWLALVAVLHRVAQGGSVYLRGLAPLSSQDPTAGVATWYEDLVTEPTFGAIYRASLLASQPDGVTPLTDDANPYRQHWGLVGGLLEDPSFRWFWALPAVDFAARSLELATFAWFPAMGPPTPQAPADAPPALPLNVSVPDAGFAVLRSAWSQDATYLLLEADHGALREHGLGHEHADPLAFVLWAHGTPLALDPGYIRWEDHRLVKYGRDHNIVLVDGQGPAFPLDDYVEGPPHGDAWIEEAELDGEQPSLLGRATYRDVTLWRRVVRLPGGRFLLADRVLAEAPHAYTWVLHGFAGGDVPDSAFELLPDGARWSRPGAALRAVVAPTEGTLATSHRLEEHTIVWGQWAYHEALDAQASMDQAAGFLAALAPTAATEAEPALTAAQRASGVTSVTIEAADSAPESGWLAVLNTTGGDASVVGPSSEALVAAPGLSVWSLPITSGPTHWAMTAAP